MKTLITLAPVALTGCGTLTPEQDAAMKAMGAELQCQNCSADRLSQALSAPYPCVPVTQQPKPSDPEVCNAYTDKCTDVIVTRARTEPFTHVRLQTPEGVLASRPQPDSGD